MVKRIRSRVQWFLRWMVLAVFVAGSLGPVLPSRAVAQGDPEGPLSAFFSFLSLFSTLLCEVIEGHLC